MIPGNRVAAAAIVLIGAVPLLIVSPAFLQDWPNHLAGVQIAVSLLKGDRLWSQYYSINHAIVPNMALDFGLGIPIWLGVNPDVASQIFLLATYILFVTGGVALARHFAVDRRITVPMLVLLFYTGPFFYGLINYVFGLGLALWVLALWLGEARFARQLAIACLGTVLVFISHLIAAGLLVMSMLLLETFARRRLTLRRTTAVPALVLLMVLTALVPHGAVLPIGYTHGPGLLGIAKGKLFDVVHEAVDGAGLLGAAVMAAAIAIWLSLWLSRPRPACAGLIGAVCLLFLLVPAKIGRGDLFDYRLLLMVWLLAVTTIAFRDLPQRYLTIASIALCLCAAARTGIVAHALVENRAVMTQFDRDARLIPPDSMLLSAHQDHPTWSQYWHPPMTMMAARAAQFGVFVPSVFALPSQQTIVLDSQFRRYDVADQSATPQFYHELGRVCTTWHQHHTGIVALLVIYTPPERPTGNTGFGFRLLNGCTLRKIG